MTALERKKAARLPAPSLCAPAGPHAPRTHLRSFSIFSTFTFNVRGEALENGTLDRPETAGARAVPVARGPACSEWSEADGTSARPRDETRPRSTPCGRHGRVVATGAEKAMRAIIRRMQETYGK